MNQSENLPPKVYKSKGIAWTCIIINPLFVAGWWWIMGKQIILCSLLSIGLLWIVYDLFKRRNDCITLNEEGISLDHATLLHNSKKFEHIDIKWNQIGMWKYSALFECTMVTIFTYTRMNIIR